MLLKDLPLEKAYKVPLTVPVDALLHDMQGRRTHMAIVMDEYGGVAGIVTIEDMIEEIVGEIVDETDREIAPIRFNKKDNAWYVSGHVLVDDMLHDMSIDIRDVEYDCFMDFAWETVAYMITSILERFPEQGEELKLSVSVPNDQEKKHTIIIAVYNSSDSTIQEVRVLYDGLSREKDHWEIVPRG